MAPVAQSFFKSKFNEIVPSIQSSIQNVLNHCRHYLSLSLLDSHMDAFIYIVAKFNHNLCVQRPGWIPRLFGMFVRTSDLSSTRGGFGREQLRFLTASLANHIRPFFGFLSRTLEEITITICPSILI